ncbi:amidohydrolase family protein [Vibrio salinus]|uniref:amidohydrolase family protein n=1 Tax=Vibrio salinus TaxID=2899784 RepID=UPI001E2E19EA|nr:amidohydrolase family protein [Vibrio salinus]MCE0492415.1 amidohydrolase family protein [Vibrio salinus]
MKIIDAHQHFWQYNNIDFSWIDNSMEKLKANFLPEDYLSNMSTLQIIGSVAIEARQSNDETNWLLELSDKHDFILGVVGWIDLKDKDLERHLVNYKKFPKLKGFRHVIHDEPELDFMLDSDFIKGVELLAKYNYTYDILIKSDHLDNTIAFLEQLPAMNIVIDHIAKPHIKQKQWNGWADKMAYIATNFPHVYCKISGVVTEADWHSWKSEQIRCYIKEVIKQFGHKRIMFGSDWPVCQIAAPINKVIELCQISIDECDVDNPNLFYYENAKQFYSL